MLRYIILLLSFFPAIVVGQWTSQGSIQLVPKKIQMIDSLVGFISTSQGLIKTDSSWVNFTWCSNNETVNSFQALNESTIVKGSLDRDSLKPVYSETFRGCRSWQHTVGDDNIAFNAVKFKGDTVITNLDAKKLIKSDDFGWYWDTLTLSTKSGVVYGIHFTTNKTLLVTKSLFGIPMRQLFRSTDNGRNWNQVSTPAFQGVIELFVTESKKVIWAVGQNGQVSKSEDLGKTWNTIAFPANVDLVNLHFVNDSVGYVCGGNTITADSGRVYRTRNGGKSWEHITPPTKSFITGIFFVNDSVGFATAHDGRVFKTTNGGGPATRDTLWPNAVEDKAVELAKHEIKLFPNPSHGKLKVTWNFQTPRNGMVVLLDSRGRIIARSPMGSKQNLELAQEHLNAGLYFVSVPTPEGREVLRWVKK